MTTLMPSSVTCRIGIALDAYDRAAGIPSHREVLRFQTHTEVRYLAQLLGDLIAQI